MRIRTWLSCALTAALLVGCSGDPTPVPRNIQEVAGPEKTPPPPAPPPDVVGDVVEVDIRDLSPTGTGLFAEGTARDGSILVDQDAVDLTVDAAAAWLDAHLTDLQSGGPGRVADAGLTGDAADASSGLTAPDRPVTAATYRARVGARGSPEWVAIAADVDREDGQAGAWFVFLPNDDGVRLVAARPDDGTAAPPPADPASTESGEEDS